MMALAAARTLVENIASYPLLRALRYLQVSLRRIYGVQGSNLLTAPFPLDADKL